jgi:lipopolysaccharide/colanic/teichoic acid biosynthesis glycosyltransferase
MGLEPRHLREALRIQEEQGGHVGAILVRMGACTRRLIADALLEQVRLSRTAEGQSDLALRARENPSIVGLQVRCRPLLTQALVVLSDFATLGVAIALAWLAAGTWPLPGRHVFAFAAAALMAIAAFAAAQLYSTTPPSPPEEIRRITISVSAVACAIMSMAWIGRGTILGGITVATWALAWALSLLLVPVGRAVLRARFARCAWWGLPVVVLGAGKLGRAVVRTLKTRPQLGLKPVALLDDDTSRHGTLRARFDEDDIAVESVRQIEAADPVLPQPEELDTPSVRAVWGQFSEVQGVPLVGGIELAPVLSQRLKITCAVVAMPKMDTPEVLALIERCGGSFENVLVIPDLVNLTHFGAPTRDLGGVLGIEVRRQLLLRGPRLAKRVLDLVLTSVGVVAILPVLTLLALLIKLEGGPVFYRQKRLGQDGVRFSALKFCTMYGDGEQRLQAVLERDAALRAEYEQFHKLTDDPRVTRIGRVLRKYSLDELPQLWNVLLGEMSLVGPRPYLEREIPDMFQQEAIVLRVKPGVTGIWQVTERNASTFQQRVILDVEYVRNWSPWLDVYLICRTIPVVLGGTGS